MGVPFSLGEIYFEGRIARVVVEADAEFDVEQVKEIENINQAHFGKKRYCTLVDTSRYVKATPAARAYSATAEYNKQLIARAIIVTSMPVRITANFFIKFHKPVTPTRMFPDLATAREWLNEMIAKEEAREKAARE